MLYIYFGEDDYSREEAVAKLQEALGPPDVASLNTTRLAVQETSPQALAGLCDTVPFLAAGRLVVVEGLLSLFEEQRAGRGPARRGRGGRGSGPGAWSSLAEYIPRMPSTTRLVLADGAIRQPKANPLFQVLESLGQVHAFGPLRGADLDSWVRGHVADGGGRLEGSALQSLVGTLGSNLRLLSGEIEKLLLYCQGRSIGTEDVTLLVGYVKQGNIFALADAFVEGRYREARIILYQLQEDGVGVLQILDALRRQVRIVLQTRDLLDRGEKKPDIQRALGLRLEFQMDKALRQARLHSREGLVALHRSLLKGDLAVKTGRLTDAVVLDLLLAQAGQGRGR